MYHMMGKLFIAKTIKSVMSEESFEKYRKDHTVIVHDGSANPEDPNIPLIVQKYENCGMSLTVCKVRTRGPFKDRIELYSDIHKLTDAWILAQYAMTMKEDDELIVIMPGWNLGIGSEKHMPIHAAYQAAQKLAEKYDANKDE